METLILQIFLALNIFAMGFLSEIAIRHAYAHFKKPAPVVEEELHPQPLKKHKDNDHLPIQIRQKLIEASQVHFQSVLNRSATTLERDLKKTTEKMNKQLDKVGSEIILNEMKRYRSDLEALRKQAESVIEIAQREVVEHQAELKTEIAKKQIELEDSLNKDIEAKKQEMINQRDTKVSDAVASFLIEPMQHEIDLGAQTDYLTKMLESHKAELIKEIMDES